MARYNIFDGGNELRHYDDPTSGVNGYDNVRPAQHHIERQRHILFHVNTGARPFTNEYKPLIVESGDTIATHVIGAGWVITGVGFHVKQAGKGTLTPSLTWADNTTTALADYADAGTAAVVDLSQVGYQWYRPVNGDVREVLNKTGVGYLVNQYTAAAPAEGEEAAPLGGCFGIILELVYLEDERECSCVSTPCPTEFPTPICAPNI